jgi:uncharacterized membrane protein YfcA
MELSWTLKTVGLIGLLGLFAGVASSLLGIGAGVVLVPVLSLTWDKMHDSPQKLAQGTALALMVPMALAGALRYHFGTCENDLRIAMPIAVYTVVMATLALGLPLLFARWTGMSDVLGHVEWETVVTMALGAIIGVVWLGAPLANALPTHTLRSIFGVLVIITGVRMLGWHTFIIGLFTRGGAG